MVLKSRNISSEWDRSLQTDDRVIISRANQPIVGALFHGLERGETELDGLSLQCCARLLLLHSRSQFSIAMVMMRRLVAATTALLLLAVLLQRVDGISAVAAAVDNDLQHSCPSICSTPTVYGFKVTGSLCECVNTLDSSLISREDACVCSMCFLQKQDEHKVITYNFMGDLRTCPFNAIDCCKSACCMNACVAVPSFAGASAKRVLIPSFSNSKLFVLVRFRFGLGFSRGHPVINDRGNEEAQ